MKGPWILLVMVIVAWVPPVAEGGRDVYRWRDDAGDFHFADRPGDVQAERTRPGAVRQPGAGGAGDCAHMREQLLRAAKAGRRLRVRALEERWRDGCR